MSTHNKFYIGSPCGQYEIIWISMIQTDQCDHLSGAIYHQPLELKPKYQSNDRDQNREKHNLMKS